MGFFSSHILPFVLVTATTAGTAPNTSLLTDADRQWPMRFNLAQSKVHANTLTGYFSCPQEPYHAGFFQLVESSVFGVVSSQFNFRIYTPNGVAFTPVWVTTKVERRQVTRQKTSVEYTSSNGISLTIQSQTQTYTLRANLPDIQVHLTFTNPNVSYKVGTTGESFFGSKKRVVRHFFLPRCLCEGTVRLGTAAEPLIPLWGHGQLIDAYQGLKPYLAANSWRFFNFQSETVSLHLMQFTTPQKYGLQCVTIAGLVVEGDEAVVFTGGEVEVRAPEGRLDRQSKWRYPVDFGMSMSKPDGEDPVRVRVERQASAPLRLVCRYDVLAEVPEVVKALAGPLLHIKPYVFQFDDPYRVVIQRHGREHVVTARGMFEASYIGEN